MKKVFALLFISLAIIFCISYMKWTEFKKEIIQMQEENARAEELKKQNEEMEKRKLKQQEKKKEFDENLKYLSSLQLDQYRYYEKNGTYTNDLSKLNFYWGMVKSMVSRDTSSFTTGDGITYSIAEAGKVTATKPQEYTIEWDYDTEEIICKDNGSNICKDMGLAPKTGLETPTPLPKENDEEARKIERQKQKEFIEEWKENKKKREEEMINIDLSSPKGKEMTEQQKLEVIEYHRKRFESTRSINLITDLIAHLERIYHRSNKTYTSDFNELNFDFDNIEGIVSKESSSFTTKEGIIYSIDKEKVTATLPQKYIIKKYYRTNHMYCEDNDNRSCVEIGMWPIKELRGSVHVPEDNNQELKGRKKQEQKEYIKKVKENLGKQEKDGAKRQVKENKQSVLTEEQKLEIIEKNRRNYERVKLARSIMLSQYKYHKSNGTYSDDFSKLNLNFNEIEGVVSKTPSSFTTKDGVTYSIDDKKVTRTATQPQKYIIEQYYNGIIACKDDGVGICADMGLMAGSISEGNNSMYKNGTKKTAQQQTSGQRQSGFSEKEKQELREKFQKFVERSKILSLIGEAQYNYYRMNDMYTDELSKLSFSWDNIDILSKDASSFTTTDGRIYSIKDKEKATLTKPQEYILESYYKTQEITCRDIRSGACAEMGMTSRSL